MVSSRTFFPLTILFVCFFQTGNSISCHVCNSAPNYDGAECENIGKNTQFVKNCTEIGVEANVTYERCRKIVQDVEGDYRTIRSCATWPDKAKDNKCVDRTGTAKIKVKYCECNNEDLCNAVSPIISSIATIIVAFIFTILN